MFIGKSNKFDSLVSQLASPGQVHFFFLRDIASRNCLVNAQRIVKLGDFGMTRLMYENDYYKFNRRGMMASIKIYIFVIFFFGR